MEFDSQGVGQRYQELLADCGVDPARVEFEGHSPLAEYLQRYGQVDITLDPFPHNGGLTTCDSLWMGVPPVTSPTETFAGRQSLSFLSTVGLSGTIARDLDEYVEIAVRLASDLPRLAAIRAGLRQRVAKSPLCDGPRFAANLMGLLRGVWRDWCNRSGAT
jgi:predicted O-linked N-acetylglucosamine transferase (SPINDLY family)